MGKNITWKKREAISSSLDIKAVGKNIKWGRGRGKMGVGKNIKEYGTL